MGILDFLKKQLLTPGGTRDADFRVMVLAVMQELTDRQLSYLYCKPSESKVFTEQILTLSDADKIGFIVQGIEAAAARHKKTVWSFQDKDYQFGSVWNTLLLHLFRTRLEIDDEGLEAITTVFFRYDSIYRGLGILHWPVNPLLGHIERMVRNRPLSKKAKTLLCKIRDRVESQRNSSREKESARVIDRIDGLLFLTGKTGESDKPLREIYFPGDDDFASWVNPKIRELPDTEKARLFPVLALAKKAGGAKPSKKFLDEALVLTTAWGAETFRKTLQEWTEFLCHLKEKETDQLMKSGQEQFIFRTIKLLTSSNSDMLKGLIWMGVRFHDQQTIFHLAKLAERAYKKIPGKGPAAAALGNACLYTLANSKGLGGIGQLSRLKLRIKQSSTQAAIDKYLREAAAVQGISIHEIEDLAVDDFGLTGGRKSYSFDKYTAVLEITGVGKSSVQWLKPDGGTQKSVPAFVKEKHAAGWKKIRETAAQVELTVSAQRDRLDRMLKTARKIPAGHFSEHYFSHGLMGYLATRLIWLVEQGDRKQTVIRSGDRWVNAKGAEVFSEIPADAIITLWHPVFGSVEEIRDWRELILDRKISQPLKQAFRELYLLTDAELNTRIYSNRMAAHILKQHQFNSLAKNRGWKYSLLGAFDSGQERGLAFLDLPDEGMRIEFWVNEVNAENAVNDTGIWNYVATDQIRFISLQTEELIPLIDIPKLIFSETMRDTDLFVGVASVGNDPAWQDNGGLPVYRNYWTSYSFGELTELAKTRKAILERLLPRLKIAQVAEIKERFLIVRGRRRTYKIHLGSTNILMEPNDQYLCIVPDRGKPASADPVFLPFEGDNGLSIILSKAFLLASDDTITDETINRQIDIGR